MLDRLRQQGDLHFVCSVGKVRLGYCYIRKNACSSFKRMFLDMAEVDDDPTLAKRPIDFMIKHQMMRSADAPACDRIVFVYRDPVERIASLYKNKFIMRDGHEDLFRSYARLIGQDPDQVTFRDFVMKYLQPNFRLLDPHVLPQIRHLKRFHYSDAIPMQSLHTRMTHILGESLADRYFSTPVNATAKSQTVDLPDAADCKAGELAEQFSKDGTMPANSSLLDGPVKERLQELYAADIQMIARLDSTT